MLKLVIFPSFEKKTSKKDNAILLLALYSVFLNLERAIAKRVKVTCIDKLFNVKRAFKPLLAVMKIVDGYADQELEAMTSSKAKCLNSLTVSEE